MIRYYEGKVKSEKKKLNVTDSLLRNMQENNAILKNNLEKNQQRSGRSQKRSIIITNFVSESTQTEREK